MGNASDPSLDSGLCGIARWVSAVALIGCVLAWGILGTVTLTDRGALDEPAQRFAWTLLAMITLACLGTHLTSRSIRWMRRIVRNQETIFRVLLSDHESEQSEGEGDAGLDPASVALARQLTARLHSVS